MPNRKKKLSAKLRNKLFDEVRSTCPCPDCRTPPGVSMLEIHHIDGDPNNNDEANLLAICSVCHTKAEKRLITDIDVRLWKQMLVNRMHPRLGEETGDSLKKAPPRIKKVSFKATANNGPVYQAENMHFRSSSKKRPSIAPAPDSIAAHAAERHYIDYLKKAYFDCRKLEGNYDPRRLQHPARINNAFHKALGGESPGNANRKIRYNLAAGVECRAQHHRRQKISAWLCPAHVG